MINVALLYSHRQIQTPSSDMACKDFTVKFRTRIKNMVESSFISFSKTKIVMFV